MLKEILVDFIYEILPLDVRNRAGVNPGFSELLSLDAIVGCTIDVNHLFYLGLDLFVRIASLECNDVANFCRSIICNILRRKQPVRLLQRGAVTLLEEDYV